MGTHVDISCLFLRNTFPVLPCIPIPFSLQAMSCSDPRDNDCYSEGILCMIVSKIVFPVSVELKHRSDYAGPDSKSTAWIVYISMIKVDCPKTISYSYFPFCSQHQTYHTLGACITINIFAYLCQSFFHFTRVCLEQELHRCQTNRDRCFTWLLLFLQMKIQDLEGESQNDGKGLKGNIVLRLIVHTASGDLVKQTNKQKQNVDIFKPQTPALEMCRKRVRRSIYLANLNYSLFFRYSLCSPFSELLCKMFPLH